MEFKLRIKYRSSKVQIWLKSPRKRLMIIWRKLRRERNMGLILINIKMTKWEFLDSL